MQSLEACFDLVIPAKAGIREELLDARFHGHDILACYPAACRGAVFSILAEGAGFEPANLSVNGFQDRRLRPLGHPSGVAHLMRPAGNGPAGYLFFGKAHLTRRRVFCQSLSCRVEGAPG